MSRYLVLVVIAFLNHSTAAMCGAQVAPQGGDWPAPLRILLGAFESDSMRNRPIGSQSHARAIELVQRELNALAKRSNGRMTQSMEHVPFERVTPDPMFSNFTIQGKYAFGIDYVPLSGFGLEPPDVTDVESSSILLGRLGPDNSRNRDAANGRFAVVLPPLRADGEPDYQLTAIAAYLRPFNGAAAVVVMSRDLMPRRVIDRMLRPRIVLKDALRHERATINRPPVVIAVSRSLAGFLRSVDPGKKGSVRIIFARDSLAHPAPNLLAMLPGSDPVLRDELVVLVAHTDTDASEDSASAASPVSLLAIAEHLAASEMPLRRSVLLLWASGYERGQLGLRHFLNSRASAQTSIVAIASIDALGAPGAGKVSGDPYAADGCNSVIAQAAARGIRAVSISSNADSTFVGRALSLVQGLANAEPRAKPTSTARSTVCPPY